MTEKSIDGIISGLIVSWPTPDEIEFLRENKNEAIEVINGYEVQLRKVIDELTENGDNNGLIPFYGSIAKSISEIKRLL
ncbi:hypothetical protein DFP94_11497 [Fontibacillus phaseoli]|uniref:Uncharacterized protein n=1 Tax=Fontibacillus phaseoli TaxID=1416533 RepID=A0A369B265_9BACL|nr:hypothetical protein [Fontibacillus phaseoli]RCX15649.1 hypothetical protein DFP94_11497 [Fontibacillus phaseoli]